MLLSTTSANTSSYQRIYGMSDQSSSSSSDLNGEYYFPPDMDFDQAFNQFTFDFKIQTIPNQQEQQQNHTMDSTPLGHPTPPYHHYSADSSSTAAASTNHRNNLQFERSNDRTTPPSEQNYNLSSTQSSIITNHNSSANAANAFSSLLSEQESWALNNFLDKVSVDPNFLLDPKVADGLLNLGYGDVQDPPLDTEGSHLPLAFSSDPNFPPKAQQQQKQHDNSDDTAEAHKKSLHDQNPLPAPKQKTRKQSDSSDNNSSSTTVATSIRRSRREGLSEDQKRKNHISSEKKRRDLIKQQFQKMCSLVPKLAELETTSSKSKSAVLLTVYEFLVYMIEQNKMIRSIMHTYGINHTEIPTTYYS